jgi:hypothetical protein
MDDLLYYEPKRQVNMKDDNILRTDVEQRPSSHRREVKSKHKSIVYTDPTHSSLSSKGVLINIPAFANLKNIIKARPSHSTLTQGEVDKATLVKAMYEQNDNQRSAISEYLAEQNSPYTLMQEVSDNVMVVRNRNTGETKVVVKGINPTSVSDYADLQMKLASNQEFTQTYQDALSAAIEYNAGEIIGHSRGGSTAIAVAQTTGVRSTGFNSVITTENVHKAHYAPSTFRHTEFSNGADIIVNALNDISNPHGFGRHPTNMEIRTFAGIQGEGTLGQHTITQWTRSKLQRLDAIELPAETLAFQARHAGDLITAEMFSKGLREGKTYRQILMENEGGFGVVDDLGRFTSRNFRGNNMSKIFEAVGGSHTPDEIEEMASHGTQTPHEHTLTDNEVRALKNGDGVHLVDHALDGLAEGYERLTPLQPSTLREVGSGIYKGVSDTISFKQSALEGFGAGIAGELVARGSEAVIGRAGGETGNLQHSGVSFATAGALVGGASGAKFGLGAGLVGEATRYGTDELLKKMGAGKEVRGNLDAIMEGASAGAVLGSEGGLLGAVVGAGVGAIVNEGAYVATHYGSKIEHFFENIF